MGNQEVRDSLSETGFSPRCQAMITVSATGRQCRRAAEPDTDPPRCAQHLMGYESKGLGHVHRFYAKTFRPALRQAVAEMLDGVPLVDQLDGREELALLRHSASHAVGLYAAACEGESLDAKVSAAAMMREQLESVLDAIKTVASVEDVKVKVTGVLAVHLQQFVGVIIDAASQVFQDDHRVAEFEEKIRELLSAKPAGLGLEGTVLTPDQDVTAMDGTIPHES